MDIIGKLEMEMAIKQMYSMMTEQIELYKLTSKMMREYYNALIEVGFSKQEALSIVKEHGIKAGNIGQANKED